MKNNDGFLVLSRYKNESVLIGDDIEVPVTKISYDRVKLMFRAPKDVPVNRKEVWENINDFSKESA